MHRFAMKEELGELIFEVLFFVYVKSIRNDELDVFCCWDSLILWIIQLILMLIISCYVLFCTFLLTRINSNPASSAFCHLSDE